MSTYVIALYSLECRWSDERSFHFWYLRVFWASTMDIELLISAVQNFPVLWDTAHGDYKDKNKKNNAWIEVSKGLFEDFKNYCEEKQKLTSEYY